MLTAIEALGPSLSVYALVSNTNGPAIFASSTMDVIVSDGLVRSQNMNAICVCHEGTTVTVTGAEVDADYTVAAGKELSVQSKTLTDLLSRFRLAEAQDDDPETVQENSR
ncbi:hypothetical protein [Caproiciproducens sp.]|uniref:hypothetical protein n=1 Tax=Caproiciproducens sp. TaxID=1954376 RepID=UPI00289DED41|nr:hypothetical protein [Caproiciproducens sp.]